MFNKAQLQYIAESGATRLCFDIILCVSTQKHEKKIHLDEALVDVLSVAERDLLQHLLVELHDELGDRFGERLEEVALLALHGFQVHRADDRVSQTVEVTCSKENRQSCKLELKECKRAPHPPGASLTHSPWLLCLILPLPISRRERIQETNECERI